MNTISTFKLNGWKISTAVLAVLLLASWIWMLIVSTLNNATMETVRSQQFLLREITNKVITLEIQVLDLQSRNKSLYERIESFNTLRQRDNEYLQNQINRNNAVKVIR
jgi:hypothetical protein